MNITKTKSNVFHHLVECSDICGEFSHGKPIGGIANLEVCAAIKNSQCLKRGRLHPLFSYDQVSTYLNSQPYLMGEGGFVPLSQEHGLSGVNNFTYTEEYTTDEF